ncbi:MAG: MFS transporter [Candidatus Hodarchaeota archaeon]
MEGKESIRSHVAPGEGGDPASTPRIAFKKLWPLFLGKFTLPLTYAYSAVNIVFISNLIWPGDDYHALDIGVYYGIGIFMVAFSGLLFGYLADRHSRVKLLAVITLGTGFALVLDGFVPAGLRTVTYAIFLGIYLVRQFFDGGAAPVSNSYIDDASSEEKRSQVTGIGQALWQLAWLSGVIISGFVFEHYWRSYFWIFGAFTITMGVLLFKGKEPKRGATKNELKSILKIEGTTYDYKLTAETLKSTVFSRTNIIAMVEGVMSQILNAVPMLLVFAYAQDKYNFSPSIMSLITVCFGIPGALIGTTAFSSLSDKLGKKNLKNRIYFIFSSIVVMYVIYMCYFLVPLKDVSGQDFFKVLTSFNNWIMCLALFGAQLVWGLFIINQTPLLQKINLPEAQGAIGSANQFLEMIGHATGGILSGVLLNIFNNNYQVTMCLLVITGLFGATLWLFALKWVNKDAERVSGILQSRAKDMEANSRGEV